MAKVIAREMALKNVRGMKSDQPWDLSEHLDSLRKIYDALPISGLHAMSFDQCRQLMEDLTVPGNPPFKIKQFFRNWTNACPTSSDLEGNMLTCSYHREFTDIMSEYTGSIPDREIWCVHEEHHGSVVNPPPPYLRNKYPRVESPNSRILKAYKAKLLGQELLIGQIAGPQTEQELCFALNDDRSHIEKQWRERENAAKVVRNPWISMSADSTPEAIREVYAAHPVKGGFYLLSVDEWGELFKDLRRHYQDWEFFADFFSPASQDCRYWTDEESQVSCYNQAYRTGIKNEKAYSMCAYAAP